MVTLTLVTIIQHRKQRPQRHYTQQHHHHHQQQLQQQHPYQLEEQRLRHHHHHHYHHHHNHTNNTIVDAMVPVGSVHTQSLPHRPSPPPHMPLNHTAVAPQEIGASKLLSPFNIMLTLLAAAALFNRIRQTA